MKSNRLNHAIIATAVLLTVTTSLAAHQGGHHALIDVNAAAMPLIADHFKPFQSSLQLRQDKEFLYVGSNSIPDHPMMIGIRAWQQQVPMPQCYVGDNAWRIPLRPVPAKSPMSTKDDFLRGAIALAVNGVPIVNPLNNRGDDALLAGELDKWGGHCGRGDDYHYHIAPVHLEDVTGKGKPIAYALDGYPIFGYQDMQAADFAPLDQLGGHNDKSGNYHYHATQVYPYVNGGFYGEVTKHGGQVDPQPRDSPVRPAGEPLRGATITNFNRTGNRFQLDYNVSGRKGAIIYTVKNDGNANFTYQDPSGNTRTESYRRRRGETYLPLSGETVSSEAGSNDPAMPRLTVTSSAFLADSEIPIEFTGDGLGESPPIAWTEGPEGTKSYAINVWHVPGPGDVKSYWLVYDIPADVTSLPQGVSDIGTEGYNDKDRTAYDPMRSKGPGTKEYHITVYALSKKLDLSSSEVTRDVFLQSIANTTLAEGTLSYRYTRRFAGSWMIAGGLVLASIAALALWFRSRKQ